MVAAATVGAADGTVVAAGAVGTVVATVVAVTAGDVDTAALVAVGTGAAPPLPHAASVVIMMTSRTSFKSNLDILTPRVRLLGKESSSALAVLQGGDARESLAFE